MPFTHHQLEYAGFFRRSLAFLLDALIASLLSSSAIVAVYGWEKLKQLQHITLSEHADWQLLLIEHGLPALWVIGFWLLWMATPGKMLFDCQIVDARSQGKPRLTQWIIRYLAYIASAIPLGLGFAWILIDKRNQAWHDKLSETLVIMQDDSRQPMESM